MGDISLIKKHLLPETVMFQHPFTLDTPLHIAASGLLSVRLSYGAYDSIYSDSHTDWDISSQLNRHIMVVTLDQHDTPSNPDVASICSLWVSGYDVIRTAYLETIFVLNKCFLAWIFWWHIERLIICPYYDKHYLVISLRITWTSQRYRAAFSKTQIRNVLNWVDWI